jgi:hypothetical protein
MRKSTTLIAFGALVASLALARSGQAATFSVNFCPGANGCPGNVTEASLTFDEILTGSDPNDYELTLKIVGGAGEPQFIDSVQFTITGVMTPTGYEAKPTLTDAPTNGDPWSVYWDQIAGNPTDCSSDTLQGQGVCAGSTGNGASTDGTNIWKFLIDLDDQESALHVGSAVDLRAHFLKIGPHDKIQNGGMLSPEAGGYLETGSNETSTNETSRNETGTVPEPAALSLLGLGLAATARRLRRK